MKATLFLTGLGLPLALWALAAPAAPREKVPPPALTPPPQDLVIVTPARPLALRLQLQIEGVASSAWEQYLERLFAFLDADGNGTLSEAELRCAPSAEQVKELTRDSNVVTAEPAPSVADIAGTEGAVTLAPFKTYYQREGQGPLAVELGRRTTENDETSDALWRHLDTDKDGKLSRAELRSADRLLAVLDQNEDDVVRLDELMGRTPAVNYRFEQPVRFQDALARGPLVLQGAARPGELSAGLMRRYDLDKNGLLTRAEIGLPLGVFERFDANRDDEWGPAEVDRWLRDGSEGRIDVVLGKPPAARAVFVPGRAAPDLRWEGEARRLVVGARWLLELGTGLPPEAKSSASANRLIGEFQRLDSNRNGKLERTEVFKPPFAWVAILRLIDRDDDDVITRKELDAWLELHRDAVVSVVTLTLADRGTSLFELIDDDRDGRLGPRNLVTAWERLKVWDRDGDNVLTRDELPRQYHLTLSRGGWQRGELTAPAYGPLARTNVARGPMWFRKMDQNSDGDISPREFLGGREAFRKLDRDNDGLINVTEAEQAQR